MPTAELLVDEAGAAPTEQPEGVDLSLAARVQSTSTNAAGALISREHDTRFLPRERRRRRLPGHGATAADHDAREGYEPRCVRRAGQRVHRKANPKGRAPANPVARGSADQLT